jgi:orotate phosphoribosyltransferase
MVPKDLEGTALMLFDTGVMKFVHPSEVDAQGFKLHLHRARPNFPRSPFYFDPRPKEDISQKLEAHPIIRELALHLGDLVVRDGIEADHVVGVPEGGNLFAKALYNLFPHRFPKGLMVMKKMDPLEVEVKIVEGNPAPRAKLLFVENAIVRGDSVLQTAAAPRLSGYVVSDVCTVLDWNAGGRERLEETEMPIAVHALLNLKDLIFFYVDRGKIPSSVQWHTLKYIEDIRGLSD